MRPFGDEKQYMQMIREHNEELRKDWLSANGAWANWRRRAGGLPGGVLRVARAARVAAGRSLVGLGRRVLPGEIEPCS